MTTQSRHFESIEAAVRFMHGEYADMEAALNGVVSWHVLEPKDKAAALHFIKSYMQIPTAEFTGYFPDVEDIEEIYTAWVTYAFALGDMEVVFEQTPYHTGSKDLPH